MTHQEVRFAAARCRIQVEPARDDRPGRAFTATMLVVDRSNEMLRPLIGLDGRRIEIRAESEDRAVSRAMAFLERRLGAVQYVATSSDPASRLLLGDPITVA